MFFWMVVADFPDHFNGALLRPSILKLSRFGPLPCRGLAIDVLDKVRVRRVS